MRIRIGSSSSTTSTRPGIKLRGMQKGVHEQSSYRVARLPSCRSDCVGNPATVNPTNIYGRLGRDSEASSTIAESDGLSRTSDLHSGPGHALARRCCPRSWPDLGLAIVRYLMEMHAGA